MAIFKASIEEKREILRFFKEVGVYDKIIQKAVISPMYANNMVSLHRHLYERIGYVTYLFFCFNFTTSHEGLEFWFDVQKRYRRLL